MSTEENLSQIKGFDKIQNFYDNNKQTVLGAGVVLILVAAGIYYYSNFFVPGKEEKAQAELFMAERYFKLDSAEKALYGDGQSLGLIDVADQYGSTDAGILANYYAGRLLMGKGEYEAALEHLDRVAFSDYFLAATSQILVGDCHSELGDYEKAGDIYSKAAAKRSNDVSTPKALYKAAIAYEASGNFSDALSALNQLKEDHNDSRESESVNRFIARIEAKLAAK